jgi:hypothetical protein
MSDLDDALTAAAYALFALEQSLPLAKIAEGAHAGSFPAADLHTPEWFAAAIESDDLMSVAPELQALPVDAEADIDLAGVDLIRVYAPEMAAARDAEDLAPEVRGHEASGAPDGAESPRESRRISLLQELSDLDD